MTEHSEGVEWEPDAWMMFHEDGSEDGHGVGPFPSPDMARAYHAVIPCDCVTTLVPMALPPGTHIMVAIGEMLTFLVSREPKLNALLEATVKAAKGDDDDDMAPIFKAMSKVVARYDADRAKRKEPPDEPVH